MSKSNKRLKNRKMHKRIEEIATVYLEEEGTRSVSANTVKLSALFNLNFTL